MNPLPSKPRFFQSCESKSSLYKVQGHFFLNFLLKNCICHFSFPRKCQFFEQGRIHFYFRDFRTRLDHLVFSVMDPLFSSNISGHLAFNTLLPIAITVFRVTVPPLTLRLCRIDLTSVVSLSLILDGLSWWGKGNKNSYFVTVKCFLVFHLPISNNLSFKGVIWVPLWSPSPTFCISMCPCVVSHVLFNLFGQNFLFLILLLLHTVHLSCSWEHWRSRRSWNKRI